MVWFLTISSPVSWHRIAATKTGDSLQNDLGHLHSNRSHHLRVHNVGMVLVPNLKTGVKESLKKIQKETKTRDIQRNAFQEIHGSSPHSPQLASP